MGMSQPKCLPRRVSFEVRKKLGGGAHGDVEGFGGFGCVLEEHFVEVAHAEEEEVVRVAGLDLEVLLGQQQVVLRYLFHHRRCLRAYLRR